MEQEIKRRARLCDAARNAEWESVIVQSEHLSDAEKAFLRLHPPGLVKALWEHFELTRDRCGCETSAHERPECSVRLIERLLLEDEAA